MVVGWFNVGPRFVSPSSANPPKMYVTTLYARAFVRPLPLYGQRRVQLLCFEPPRARTPRLRLVLPDRPGKSPQNSRPAALDTGCSGPGSNTDKIVAMWEGGRKINGTVLQQVLTLHSTRGVGLRSLTRAGPNGLGNTAKRA